MRTRWLWVLAMCLALVSYPPQWYPLPLRIKLTEWFGASGYRPLPASVATEAQESEAFCPEDLAGWRDAQEIEGVSIARSMPCVADNPYAVAAFVKGTNNIGHNTLSQSGLTADAVVKGFQKVCGPVLELGPSGPVSEALPVLDGIADVHRCSDNGKSQQLLSRTGSFQGGCESTLECAKHVRIEQPFFGRAFRTEG